MNKPDRDRKVEQLQIRVSVRQKREIREKARRAGMGIVVGCMVGTSLGMAPAALLGAQARVVDLDGPLLLERDRHPGIRYDASVMHPPPSELWG